MKMIGRVVSVARREGITDVVLGASKVPPRRRWVLPVALAMGVHVSLFFFLPHENSGEAWALATAERVRVLLAARNARPIELPPPPAPTLAEATPPSDAPRAAPSSPKRAPSRPRTQAPAQAAQIVAAVPSPSEPIDLADAFVVGGGTVYAGGTTAASGTATNKVEGPVAPAPPPVPGPSRDGPDRSRPLGLTDPDWTCTWPSEADDSPIDEQTTVVRVQVDPAGRCESVSVVRDPGHGFGAQAAQCAKQATFLPALDPHGNAIRGTAAIRVRFVR